MTGQTEGLVERSYWLVRLRWVAVAGVFFTVFFTSHVLKFSLNSFPLYATASALGLYNLAFFLLLRYLTGRETLVLINRIANAQIALDFLSLAILIHLSGGVENPFLFYFIFHMIIASILLDKRSSFLQATFVVFLFSGLVIGEYYGILEHHCLKQFIIQDQGHNLTYISGISFVFISTLYIAVYLATSVSGGLKSREKALAEMNLQLLEKDRIKSEYVLRVTHGIKEHLSAIQGCLEPVSGEIVGSLNPAQLNLVQRATHRTAKLMFFVKALLRITRIKLSRQMKMEYFSIKDVISEAVNNVASKAQEKNIALHFSLEPGVDRIRAARDYIQEALTNLLANSVKYTPPDGKVDVNTWDKGGHVLIEVIDTGIGIPQHEIERIFEEFYRASNAREVERDGTGLGLSIVKQVVEMHKGRVWVESEEGKGSKFSIELPK